MIRAWEEAVLASDGETVPATARHVALVLSMHMNPIGERCSVSLTTLQIETGYARPTVWRAIQLLELAGLLERIRYPGKTNQYRPLMPARSGS